MESGRGRAEASAVEKAEEWGLGEEATPAEEIEEKAAEGRAEAAEAEIMTGRLVHER